MIKWLDEHMEETFLVVCLVLIACISMIQVIVRKIPFLSSLQWAEEFDRFMWIWSVFISLPFRKTISLIVDVIVMLSMALLCYHSYGVIFGAKGIMSSGELSPAMRWPMWIVYIFMLIGFGLGTLRGIQMIIIHAKHFNEKELTAIEQTMKDAEEEAKAVKGGEA